MSEAPLQVRGDALSAARAAARFVAECARRAVAERGKCVVAFSGGSTPLAMLGALAAEDLPWRQLHIFQVDERAVPSSNRPPERMSRKAARSATRMGWLISGTQTTAPWPTRIRLVCIATAVRKSSGAEEWEYSSRKWCSTSQA